MSRYELLFSHCKKEKKIAFIPFVMLGDPNFEISLSIIEKLVESGADALELGIPFSDPVADGPVIQGAAIRALKNGMTPTRALELIQIVRQKYPELAIGLLVYANLVYRPGIEQFYSQCAESGVDSVLVADIPMREAEPFDQVAIRHLIDPVHIVPPQASDNVIEQVSKSSKGYVYVLGRAGVTGVEQSAQMPVNDTIQRLKANNSAPPVMGFGISNPLQVTHAREHGFAGVISGSAVVKIVEKYGDNPTELLNAISTFVRSMNEATYQK